MGNKYFIFGCGNNIETVTKQLNVIFNFSGILDNNTEKIGTVYNGLTVMSAKDFLMQNNNSKGSKIIISVTEEGANKEIVQQLEEAGYIRGVNYIEAKELCMFKYERIPGSVKRRDLIIGAGANVSFDNNSYLIKKNNRIFRVFVGESVDVAKVVIDKCDNKILGDYIVKTKIESFNKDELVVEHEYISPISFCFEWTDYMYREFVQWHIELLEELTKKGLGLIDIHALNTTFYDGSFKLFDFGSIGIGETKTKELYDFIGYLLLPLILKSKGRGEIAQFFLKENWRMDIRDIRGYVSDDEYEKVCLLYKETAFVKELGILELLKKYKEFIKEISETFLSTGWSSYQDNEWQWESNSEKWSNKMINVSNMIKKVSPKSLIDIAGNQGWYSCYHRNEIKQIIVVDTDEEALNKLYKRICDKKIRNVTPVYMSVCAPSLGHHLDGFIDGNNIKPLRLSAIERYKSEMVIALAIVHHLVFRECLIFEEVIELLSSYTNRYLLVEFVEMNDAFIRDFQTDGFEWYTKDRFESVLSSKYRIIEKNSSSPEETRTLYLCIKKEHCDEQNNY